MTAEDGHGVNRATSKHTNTAARCAISSKSRQSPEIALIGALNNSMSFFSPTLPSPKGLGEQLMRADEYLMAQSLLDKPGPGMTSSEKSNREEENEKKEVAQ